MRSHGAPIAMLLALTLLACGDTRGRYRVRADSGSRYGFRYVQDRQTGLWVHREVEVRVSTKRRLPDPLSPPEYGDLLHSTRFEPGSVGTGNLNPTRFEVHEGHRVWRFRELLGESDFKGQSAFGIQVDWPTAAGPKETEPLEIFAYPPPGDLPPDEWTTWRTASSMRTGQFGWWEETHGHEPEAATPIPYPFELRYRLLLKDHVYVD